MKIVKHINEMRKSEEGMTLPEVMVAFVIITIILLATAVVLNSSFEASSASEMRTTGVSIAQDEINKSKTRDYTSLRMIQTNDEALPTFYKNEWTVIKPVNQEAWSDDLSSEGLQFKKNVTVGNKSYNVETYVTLVNNDSFDGAGQAIQLTPTTINGENVVEPLVKRVTVVVSWDNGKESMDTNKTWIHAPSSAECIPPRLQVGGSAGNDKWDSQDRIQACEGRK